MNLSSKAKADELFLVTLVGFESKADDLFRKVYNQVAGHDLHNTRSCNNLRKTVFSPATFHAVVFSPEGLARCGLADIEGVRSAANMGNSRIYLAVGSDEEPPSGNSPMDDFIQRTTSYGYDGLVKEIDTFFHEADRIKRISTLRAIRDNACIMVYGILNHLWPVSYVIAALLVFDGVFVLAGNTGWLGRYLPSWAMAPVVFYAAFFVVHCIRMIIRNWLLAIRVAGRVDLALVMGSLVFGSAATATVYAMALVDSGKAWSLPCLLLAPLLLSVYTFCRRIRFECTSISNLQESLTDPHRREIVINDISKTRLGQNSFPLFPFRGKKLFISYMHKTPSQWSSTAAEKVCKWAANQGFEVFLDRSTIQSGTLWRKALLRAVSECNVFVALLDGDVSVTHWVLAESAYASLLRKSIGKPLTLLVIKNPDQIVRDGANPFRRIYADLFECTSGKSFGASVLAVDDERPLTDVRFLQAIGSVRPMSLLSREKGGACTVRRG